MPAADAPLDPPALRRLAVQAAQAGGATLLAYRDKFTMREKGPADLVTDADLASQKAVREVLLSARPGDAFVGEESPKAEQGEHQGRLCWIVDPLDGTTNYVHGFPMFATSVGVVLDGEIIAGAVFDPVRGEMFSASKGGGAFLGDEPIHVTDAMALGDALVAVSLPPRVEPGSPDLAAFIAVVQASRAVRRTGSAALNLAYVAAGRMDAHWAFSIHPWDAAAGVLLCLEAGAAVTDCYGRPYDVWKADYLVAATEALHHAVLSRLG
ncbi:Inositol-1-monophosphatase [Botrimarina colliarenosi]|uniref:Inositol-1-monophosphatase n=1 Tax=Botrimarina colliarenosi TaxID=2528001 RepID=A0A5C6AL76_9BACT|nr:inositol monophosphatase family protein [Botrimarina colliarenosi]TWT99935.1 Inositol-1-monophosphatase [Botrimarina colliarenosi]